MGKALRIAGLSTVLLLAGCVPSKLTVRPLSYDLAVEVSPQEHRLDAEVSIELEPLDAKPGAERHRLELRLNPALELSSVELEGATLHKRKQRKGRHRLIVEEPGERLRLSLRYAGELQQDVAAGEKEGEIHNLTVSAHIGEEGLYLVPKGDWYPRVELPDDADPQLELADYRLAVKPLDGFELVAGVERDEDGPDGELRWSSPFPLDGLVLLGGPLERASRRHGEIELHAVLAPGKGEVAEDILDASAEYLDRYQELIGPYPFREFTVLEAFFSSGFAFPTCTQIVGSQLSEYEQYRRHGYLDHELLHNWYGNGIFVDPDDGNWCEGLASYTGNYYGHVLDGDAEGARKQRRNQSNFLSAIEPDQDLPLGTFGKEDGAGRGIGYQKAASVFHMLERKIGNDAFFAGLRRLTAERMGKFTTWDDLQRAFEQEAGVGLDGFFRQWVWTGGAPQMELHAAELRPGGVSVTLSQGETAFELDVPLRLEYAEGSRDVVATMTEAVQTVEIDCETEGLTGIELDPGYHLFRRLKRDEVMPTSSLTRRADKLLVVTPAGEPADGYRILLEASERAIDETIVRTVDELDGSELAASSVLVLGEAVRHPAVLRLLSRTRSPVAWDDDGFTIEGERYDGARQAVYLTVHHPDLRGEGVTVYHGNSAAALSNARVLSFYANSLLVFDTPEGDGDVDSGDKMPRAEVIRRMDFEFHDRIDF
jgi:hypothetical protein